MGTQLPTWHFESYMPYKFCSFASLVLKFEGSFFGNVLQQSTRQKIKRLRCCVREKNPNGPPQQQSSGIMYPASPPCTTTNVKKTTKACSPTIRVLAQPFKFCTLFFQRTLATWKPLYHWNQVRHEWHWGDAREPGPNSKIQFSICCASTLDWNPIEHPNPPGTNHCKNVRLYTRR